MPYEWYSGFNLSLKHIEVFASGLHFFSLQILGLWCFVCLLSISVPLCNWKFQMYRDGEKKREKNYVKLIKSTYHIECPPLFHFTYDIWWQFRFKLTPLSLPDSFYFQHSFYFYSLHMSNAHNNFCVRCEFASFLLVIIIFSE